MMKKKSHKDLSQELSLLLSICLHVLVLLGAYYLPLRQATGTTSSYSITFTPVLKRPATAKAKPTKAPPTSQNPPAPTKPQQVVQPTQAKPTPQKAPEKVALKPPGKDTPPGETIQQVPTPAKDSTATQQDGEQKESIDERGLYKTHQGKQAGTLLELVGWIWDTVPAPQDNTDASGKIVFEIKIDELGEVIAVKTLEKTVSPLVEKIYKNALTELTFSKTADNTVYAPVSVGKVTFILRTK